MNVEDLVGSFNILGSNQDADGENYKGTLELTLDEHNRITAEWLINENQKQSGTGFFKNDILVINFNYLGNNDLTYKGVVVYTCITKDILDGFWSEKHGDPRFLGEERCFRISVTNNMVN
ncbi:hypothetical protein [Patiriisocius marinus]|uniref:Uncharacterized protein n=1 Tax=Patiriisocius marinus TaxID=1397112 RepID=A0A5J4J2M5_9FLAO|nr:hypothetical protein [Patiriisocius marinus]GER60150.1 hypothetical protein ULMA_22580 [Patiriisocius marinus]